MSSPAIYSLPGPVSTYDPTNRTWSSSYVVPLYNPNVSIGQLLITLMSQCPHNVAQICHEDGHEMKNWQLIQDAVRASLNLLDLGMREGDVLGFVAGNSRNVTAVILGAFLNCNPVSPVDSDGEIDHVKYIFGISVPKIVVCDEHNYEIVRKALRELGNPSLIYVFTSNTGNGEITGQWTTVKDWILKAHPEESSFFPPPITNGDTLPAVLILSSGSTGKHKLIPMSHAQCAYMFQGRAGNPQRILCFGKLSWFTPMSILILSLALNTPRVIVQKPFSVALFLEIVKERQVKIFSCPSLHLQRLVKEGVTTKDLQGLVYISCGGAKVPKALMDTFKVPIFCGYGSSETRGISNLGKLYKGLTVKIIDGLGNNLKAGQCGEICVAQRLSFRGYYRDFDTKSIDRGGFFHTGDVGFVDENCLLHVIDRKTDIFKFKNEFVSVTDLEGKLLSVGGIALVAVCAIMRDNSDPLLAALIERVNGSLISETDVHGYVKDNLEERFWLKGGVYFVDQLPVTASGKILRRKVTEWATEMFNQNTDIGFKY